MEVGYALMEKFTHGKHQFVVAVHTDKQHIHCHCIFNAVNMDCSGKCRNPMRSMKIVRQISDFLCAERGLSIVENPKPSQGSYRDWQDKKEPQSNRDKLKELIDFYLSAGMMFEQFITAMRKAGCEFKRGKYLAFKLPGAERFIRVKSLGESYTEEVLRKRCVGKRIVALKTKTAAPASTMRVPKLLIDIQVKLQQANSPGFEHFAVIYNLKEMAQTIIFLKERGIGTYEELTTKINSSSKNFNANQTRIKEIEERMKNISELQRHIGTYSKTKSVYTDYQRLKKHQPTAWEKFRKAEHPATTFYEANRADIVLHEAAKKYFDEQDFGKKKKFPAMQELKTEYAKLNAEKRKLYAAYKPEREELIALQTARQNVDVFLAEPRLPERRRVHDHSL